jgi:hypothetical protein
MHTETNYPTLNNGLRTFIILIGLIITPFWLKANATLLTMSAGPDASICAGATHNVSATSGCTNGGNVFAWTTSGTGTFTSPSSLATVYNPSPGDISAGSVNLTVTRTTGGGMCSAGASDFLILTILSPPTAPVVGAITQPTCATATATVALSGLPASGNWTVTASPGGATINGSGTTANFSGLAASSTYTFTVTNAAGCTSGASGNAVVNAQPATPTAPIVGAITQPTCATATATVALSGLPASGNWTVTASPGGATINGSGTTANFSGLAASSTYTFTVTNAAGCTSGASGNAVVNAQPATPTAPIVGSITQPTCATATATVALSGLPAPGNWTVTASPGGATINGSGTTANFSGLAASSTYTFTVTNAAGCTSGASGNAVINAQPATPTAPIVGAITQPTCATATATVALSGLPASGNWTVTASPGGATINGSGTTANFSGLAASSTYTFTVTNAAGCTSGASGNAVVNAQPSVPNTPNPSSNSPVCVGGTLNLIGPNLANVTFSWTGPNSFSSSLQSPSISSVSAAAQGTYSLIVTSNSGNCPSAPGQVTVTVNPIPTANAGTTQTICQGGTTNGLGGSVGGSATGGTWTSNPVGTFSNPIDLNATWTPPQGFSGDAILTLSTTGMNPCAAATSTVTITVNQAPTANAGNVQTICQGGTTEPLNGSIGGSATGGAWTSNPVGNFSNASSLNSMWTPPAGFSGDAILTLTSIGQPATCAAATSTVTVTVLQTPTASAGNGQTICQDGSTSELEGLVGESANGGTWTSIPIGTFSPNANNLNAIWSPPAGFSGNATLTLTTTGMAPCAAATSNLIVIVNATPTVNAIDSQIICLGSSTSGLNGTVGGSATGGVWSSNSGGIFTPNVNALDATWTPPAGFNGIATLTLTTTGMEPCDMATKNVEITVNPNLSAEVAYLNNPFCQDLTMDQLPQITGDAVGTFSTPSGLFIDSATGTINPNQSTSGIYNVNYTIPGLIGCPDFVYPIEIVIAPTPIADLDAESPDFMCENSEVSITASSNNIFSSYSSYEWQFLDDDNNPIGSFETGNSPLEVLFSIESFTEQSTIKVLLTETIGSCSTTSEHQITVRVEPEVCGLFELVGDVLAACSEVGSYYQWGCGPSAIQGQNSNSFVHTAFSVLNSCNAFWVEVSLYSDFSCPVYMGDVSQLTSIENYNYQPSISLYPNPAATLLNLKIDKVLSQDCMYEIISNDGKRISVGNINAGVTQSNIDINHLTSGNYFLSVVVENVRNVIPFIVSK